MRDAIQSVQQLDRNVSCDVDTTATRSSFRDSALFGDRTRFIAAAFPAVDRHFTADWLRHMVAYRAGEQVPGQRGSKWGRAPSTLDLDIVALLSPEPEMASSSSSQSSSSREDVFSDAFQLLASYCEALRLAFVVVDVLLVSYHVTRTCLSAHALWTVGFRERVTLRLADIASLRCDVRQRRVSAVPAVVVPTDTGGAVSAACDGTTRPTSESLTDMSVANHRDAALSSTLANHPVTDVYQCRQSETTCNTTERRTQPLKAKQVVFRHLLSLTSVQCCC